ncbi:MAG: zinc-ribbon domain-containing protein [Pyrinomonadaceae bacterium]|nr:zinc-ribbon domain-containing protein [Pyrinomonadaceae bacterium]MBP6211607.1 zinc-ribbon domain-containing protein [Pyrinomonadaceae bacterium]
MIIRCDNCSVSLQLDESKIPSGNFTVRCPRCQNLLRVQKDATGKGPSTVQQLEANQPAPPSPDGLADFNAKESGFQINSALKSLMSALQTEKGALDKDAEESTKPRRILLCLGAKLDDTAKVLAGSGYKVYIAQTPAQANERLREGKTEILIFSPDFAPELGGAAVLQQKANSMYSSERRRLYLISLEDNGQTMNAHDAFLRNLNLVVNENDIAQLPLILNRSLHDFNELYNYFNRANGLMPI